MKKLFCCVALTAAIGLSASQSALAVVGDQQGVMTFTATIAPTTCVLSGADINHTGLTASTKDTWASTSQATLINYDDNIRVTSCPDTMAKIQMTPTYTKADATGTIMQNSVSTGGATEVEAVMGNAGYSTVYADKQVQEFTLSGGAVDIPLSTKIRHTTGTTKATTGAMTFGATLAFTQP
ncbi:hypothetical protein [Enterobacter ludwigii]|uniref:hypothetical protein n=1 Tax=Enterobacter ludwigii TaxID=299767 RepID=UPI00307616E7